MFNLRLYKTQQKILYLQILQFLSTSPSPKEPDESSNEPDSSSEPTLLSKTSLNILPPPSPPNDKLPATEDERDEMLFKSFAIGLQLLDIKESFKSNELTSLSTIESTVEALEEEVIKLDASNALATAVIEDDSKTEVKVQLLASAVLAMIGATDEGLGVTVVLFKICGTKSSIVAIYEASLKRDTE